MGLFPHDISGSPRSPQPAGQHCILLPAFALPWRLL
jgi:hypothetical protein